MRTNRFVLGIAVVAILVIVTISSLEARTEVDCARFWQDNPTAAMFSRQETPSLWPVWDGSGGYALEWGEHQFTEGWVDLGNGETYEVNLVIPDSENASEWFLIASSVQRTWENMREMAKSANHDLFGFTAKDLEETKGWGWQYPMPVWSWVVVLDLPGPNDPVILGPFFRLGCGQYGMNAVAFPGFDPKFNEGE